MKYIVFIVCLIPMFSFANLQNHENKKMQAIDKQEEISKKEKAYQEYKKLKEKENQKLEDDGFCSCSND